jgi:hypothetical protein
MQAGWQVQGRMFKRQKTHATVCCSFAVGSVREPGSRTLPQVNSIEHLRSHELPHCLL